MGVKNKRELHTAGAVYDSIKSFNKAKVFINKYFTDTKKLVDLIYILDAMRKVDSGIVCS